MTSRQDRTGAGSLGARLPWAALFVAAALLSACGNGDEDNGKDTDSAVADSTGGADGVVDGTGGDDGGASDGGGTTVDGGVTDTGGGGDSVLTTRSLRFVEDMQGVWGSGPDDIWWVGSKGTVLHYNGSVLAPRKSGTEKDLFAVWGRGPKDVWFAGDSVLLHWNGLKMVDRTPDDLGDVVLRAVHAPADKSTVLIGGDDGVILRVLESGSIMKEKSNSALKIREIRAINAGNVWAIGDKGQALRLSGGTWSSVPLPKANADLHGLALSPGGRLYTVGVDGYVAATEGKLWEASLTNDPKSRDLFGVWAISEKEAWAVGKDGALIHHLGTKWNLTDIDGTYMKTRTFRSVWGIADGDDTFAFAVGDGGAGIRFSGATDKWLDFRAETTAHLNAVTPLPDGRMVIAGDGGLLLEAKDDTSRFVDLGVAVTGTNLRGVAPDGAKGFWAVGESGVTVHVDAAGTPTVHVTQGGQRLSGVALVGKDVVAVGNGGTALRWDGKVWQSETTGVQFNLSAIAAHGDTAWAVGEFGTVVKRDKDGKWTKEASGESFNLHRVVAWADGAVAVGDNGLVLAREGGKWTKVFESPGLFLYGVTRRGDGTVVAVGWKGTLVVGSGKDWKAVDSGLPNVLLDVGAVGKSAVVVGHKGGIYQVAEAL